MRNPAQDPQPGDVLRFQEQDPTHGGQLTTFLLGVTERTPRRVQYLTGNYTPETGGSIGGSPSWVPLASWRGLAAGGTFPVLAEEGFYGWKAVQQAFLREGAGGV